MFRTIAFYKKSHLAFFTTALCSMGVAPARLRYARSGCWWVVRAPETKIVQAVFMGWVAGGGNRAGYCLGLTPEDKWQKTFPVK